MANSAPAEEELLAGLEPLHQCRRRGFANCCQSSPGIFDSSARAVDHLVVAERQHVVLAAHVHRPEGDLAVMPRPMHRVALHMLQRDVVIAHVRPKPSPPTRVRRLTLGHAVDSSAWVTTSGYSAVVNGLVQLAQEPDRLEVLAPAELVRDPLAGVT
ncbi:MAG: hypothetical protein R2697_02545 [Ilumatobacteraceae bacterium]